MAQEVLADERTVKRPRMPREAYLLFCGLFLSIATQNLITPLLPALRDAMHLSLTSVGTYVSAYGLARLIVDLPSGALTSRVGPRPVAIAGVLLNSGSSIVAAFAPNFGLLLAARVGTGVGAGLIATVVLSALSGIAPPEIRGRVMSLYQVANNLGIALYPLIGGLLGSLIGWRAGFVGGAVAALLSGVVFIPVMARIGHLEFVNSKRSDQTSGSSVRYAVSALALFAIYFGVVANMVNRHGFRNTVLPLFAAGHLGLSEVQTAVGITVMSLTGILVTIPGAALGDRIGRKRIVVAGLTMLAIGDFIYPYLATNFMLFVFAGALVGLGDFFSSSQTALLSDMVEGPRRALALSAYRFFVDLGALVGPTMLAALYGGVSPSAAIWAAAALLLLAAVIGQIGIPNRIGR